MKPRTECACHLVFFIISVSVAPPLRLSRATTSAFLLPSRAVVAGLGAGLARLPLAALGAALAVGLALAPALGFLACLGAAVRSVGLSPFRLWIAFHIRATAAVRL